MLPERYTQCVVPTESGGGPLTGGAMQTRLENTTAGGALVSVFLVVTLAAIAIPNLPDSRLRDNLSAPAAQYQNATGLHQSWGVFAPNPRGISIYVDVVVDDADGSADLWTIADESDMSDVRRSRWQKFGSYLRLDDRAALWEPFGRFAAERARAHGRQPIRVTLIRRWSETLPPGTGPDRGPERSFTFLTTDTGDSP